MKNRIYLVLLLCSLKGVAQQDPQYSMYQFNQLLINPAFAGSKDGISIVGSTRQQWTGVDGAPRTTALTVHMPVANKKVGVGLSLVNDIMGARDVIAVYGNVSYILKLSNKAKLAFGVNAGYNKYQFRFGKINFREGEVPSQLLSTQNIGTLDINSGLYFKMQGFFAGISATHLNNPQIFSYQPVTPGSGNYIYRVKMHLFYTIGKSFIINKDFIFAPTIMLKQQENITSADINLNTFLYKKLWLGVFYRTSFGPGGLIQYYINEKMRVGYSFDTGLGDAAKLGISHEVMFGFDIGGSQNNPVSNPRFL